MSDRKPIRVAVVSDHAIYRRGLTSLLLSLQDVQPVGEATDSTDALQLVEMVRPDIVLMDLKGPLENRRALANLICERWPNTRVILLMSALEENALETAAESESTFCFSKDVTEDEFIDVIYRIGQAPPPVRPALPDMVDHPIETERDEKLVQSPSRDSSSQNWARELVMAGRIQADILPEKVPMIAGWDIAAKLQSARETSGDFYDFIPIDPRNLAVVVADVTDKGMGAALFMALSSTLIRTFAVRYPTLPALTLDAVNQRIFSDTRGSMFVTSFYGVLETHTGRLRFANAGHPPAYIISSQKGKPVDQLRPTGMALGMMEKASWKQKVVRLSPGDVLLLYTDGVTEAQNQQGDFFGEQRLLEVLRSKAGRPAREIQEAILSEVRSFVGDMIRQDDIALVVVRRR